MLNKPLSKLCKPAKRAGFFKVFWLGILLIASGCEELIEFEEAREGEDLVIYGAISNSGLDEYVEISVTSDLANGPRPVDGATVQVCDDKGNC